MSLATILFWLLVFMLACFSVRERMKVYRWRENTFDSFPESKASPFSQAVLNLIGYAGGIYLSLVVLFEFLKVELPRRVSLGQVQVEPLAAFSIALAVLQPFVLKRIFILRQRWFQ